LTVTVPKINLSNNQPVVHYSLSAVLSVYCSLERRKKEHYWEIDSGGWRIIVINSEGEEEQLSLLNCNMLLDVTIIKYF
jgi:hypothetical protein